MGGSHNNTVCKSLLFLFFSYGVSNYLGMPSELGLVKAASNVTIERGTYYGTLSPQLLKCTTQKIQGMRNRSIFRDDMYIGEYS